MELVVKGVDGCVQEGNESLGAERHSPAAAAKPSSHRKFEL
jgi:hypothetical protein